MALCATQACHPRGEHAGRGGAVSQTVASESGGAGDHADACAVSRVRVGVRRGDGLGYGGGQQSGCGREEEKDGDGLR